MLAGGIPLAGVLSVDVFSNNHLAADRFRVRLAASAADWSGLHAPGLRLDVQAGWGGGWATLLVGTADGYALVRHGSATARPVAGSLSAARLLAEPRLLSTAPDEPDAPSL